MDTGRVIADAARYSAQLVRHIDKLVILSAVTIVPIANLIVLGYLARIVRATPLSSDLPRIEAWGKMLVDGLQLLAISLCYLIVGLVMTLVLYFLGSWPLAVVGIAGLFAGFVLLPIALVHSIKTGNPSSGLAVGQIVRRVSAIGWLDYLVLVIVEFILVATVMAVVASIPLLGFFVALILIPGIGVFVARATAMAYS